MLNSRPAKEKQQLLQILFLSSSLSAWGFRFIASLHGANPATKTHNLVYSTRRPSTAVPFTRRRRLTHLNAGSGVATGYRWKEQPSEIEVFVEVPATTTSKDVIFKCTPTSIDLRLKPNEEHPVDEQVLFDGSRDLKGKILMDGTFWSLSDTKENQQLSDGNASMTSTRTITVTMEKNVRMGEFDVETDWEGVFFDDEGEVLERQYVEPEELDVRDYCKRELGVDIDNIDMSKVDKSMFSSLNMTANVVDDLKKGSFVREVTKQGDLEFIEENTSSLDDNGVIKRKEFKGEGGIPFIDDIGEESIHHNENAPASVSGNVVEDSSKKENPNSGLRP